MNYNFDLDDICSVLTVKNRPVQLTFGIFPMKRLTKQTNKALQICQIDSIARSAAAHWQSLAIQMGSGLRD